MDDVARRLLTAELEVVGRFADASNATLLVRLLDRDPPPLPEGATLEDLDPVDLAVHKPRQGERPLWDFPDGTLHRREVAAYRMSELLGWGLVPTTVVRDGPFGPGSLQRYVPHDPEQHYFAIRGEAVAGSGSALRRQLEQMVLFDAVVANADRKGGHVLLEDVEGESRVRLVDHGVTFHVEDKLRTVAWDFADDPVDDADRRTLLDVRDRIGADASAFAELLSDAEVEALLARLEDVAGWEAFPAPWHERQFPWPLL